MSALKQIVTRAKQIYKKGGTWKGAIKKAGAEYRGKRRKSPAKKRKVGSAPKKKSARKKIVRRVKALHKAEGRAIKSLGSVSSHLTSAKRLITNKIGEEETKKFKAKKEGAKKKIAKRIAELKSRYRKICY
jgi:hypothetical protein